MRTDGAENQSLQRAINGIINKITLQNAQVLLNSMKEFFDGPSTKTAHERGQQAQYSSHDLTDAISGAILRYLTQGLGEGEVRMRASALLPLALIPKVIQLCDGAHSIAVLIKTLVDEFTQLYDAKFSENLVALRNLSTFFCLLFELEVYDFSFVGTFALFLASALGKSSLPQSNIVCDILLLTMQLSGEKLRDLDPSMVSAIVDAAGKAYFDNNDIGANSRMSILLDFLRAMKYKMVKRSKKRPLSVSDEDATDRIGVSGLKTSVDEAKKILASVFKNSSGFSISLNKLSITWDRCTNATDARWWIATQESLAHEPGTGEKAAFDAPKLQDALNSAKFPFPSHPYDNASAMRCDAKIDTPVRIRFWNKLISCVSGLSLDASRKAASQSLASIFTKCANAGMGSSLKKTIDKHARDFLVVFDAFIEKMALRSAREDGTYLFKRYPLLLPTLQHLCEESRDVRRCAQGRLAHWIAWAGQIGLQKGSEGPQQDQYLIILAHAQYTATFIHFQRSQRTFVSAASKQLPIPIDDNSSMAKALLVQIPSHLPKKLGDCEGLNLTEVYFIFLFSSLFILSRGKNELMQTFYPLKVSEKTKEGATIACTFLQTYFVSQRFSVLGPLIMQHWNSARGVPCSTEELVTFCTESAQTVIDWL